MNTFTHKLNISLFKNKVPVVSVAVSETPAGKYSFYGYVHDINGMRLGERADDQPQFDPAVIAEGDKVYLYSGFCGPGDKSRKGAMVTLSTCSGYVDNH